MVCLGKESTLGKVPSSVKDGSRRGMGAVRVAALPAAGRISPSVVKLVLGSAPAWIG